MSRYEEHARPPETPQPDETPSPDLHRLGEEVIRLYQAAVGFGVPAVIETPKVTISIIPKETRKK